MSFGVNSEKKWLIKSAGLILGPFSIDDVIQHLKDQKISPTDEIRSPEGRWSFVREHRQLIEVIQFLKEQRKSSKEDTELINSATVTVTNTATNNGNLTSSITPEIFTAPKNDTLPDLTAHAMEVLEAARTRVEAAASAAPVYAFRSDQKIRNSLSKGRRRTAQVAWIIFAVVLLGVLGFQLVKQKDSPKALGFEDYLRLAKSNKKVGQLDKALEFYRKAEAIRPLLPSNRLQMISLMMLVDNQNVQARQYLEQILPNDGDPGLKEEVEGYLALSYLREGQLDEAQRRYQILAQKNRKKESAKMNLMEISIIKGQFETAYENLTELLKAGFQEDTLTYYRTLALYRSPSSAINDEKLSASLLDLRRYLTKTQDFKMETLMLIAAIQTKLGNTLDVGLTMKEILNMNPDLTRDHIHEDLIHREILEWKYLGEICDITLKNFPVSAYPMGLQALCSYQRSDMKLAMEQIEKARSQFSTEPILYGLQSFLLAKTGRNSEAAAIWKLSRADESDLLILVHARACMDQKDWACAETQWKKLLTKQNNSIEALHGLAKISMEQGKKDQALDFIQQGLLVSKNYRPLVILKDQVNEL